MADLRMRIILAALVVLSLTVVALAWEPAESRLSTRWTKDVSPEKVLPEYPRPQMVRTDWTNLNGLWSYAIRPADEEMPAEWDGEILVPFAVESALSGVKKAVQPDERLWYRRAFATPALSDGGRLLLHFGAVDWKCTVWVNDKKVGEHTGGYDPFTFDITDALNKDGKENIVVVAVSDPTDTGGQPRGKQVLEARGIWYTAVTGIWQTAWLEAVPRQHITSLRIVPDIDRKRVLITIRASGGTAVRATATIDGKVAGEIGGKPDDTLHLPIAEMQLWSPETPNLYDLNVELLDGERIVDAVNSYVGMRKIEVKKDDKGINRLWLNNKVVFQYGPLDQGWWPDGLYTAPTDEALKYDIEMTKQLGFNMARKHVKVEPSRWYYWCDKLGLLVWQDMPSGDTDKSAESKTQFRKEWQAVMDALFSHPSIVMWVPFNEGWGQHDTEETADWTKKYDPSRLVNEASGWHDKGSGDVSDMHNYPGPGMREPEPKRASVLGEFGGLGMPVRGHTWQDEKNWGYVSYDDKEELTDAYVDLLTAMRPLIGRGLSAAVYTQTTDVEIEVNGLLTYDRAIVKMDEPRIVAAAKELYLPPPEVRVLLPTSELEPQTWRYTTEKPGDDWMKPGFDDARWKSGPGGFGTGEIRGAVVRTEWKSPEIWLRRTFEVDDLADGGQVMLNILHDEDAEVYLNGELVRSFNRFIKSYRLASLNGDELKLLQPGKNTIAVRCRQTTGAQYIDVGLIQMREVDAASK